MRDDSPKAEKFVVVAERVETVRSSEDIAEKKVRTLVFDKDTTLKEVFESLFPNRDFDPIKAPTQISVFPDESTLPREQSSTERLVGESLVPADKDMPF